MLTHSLASRWIYILGCQPDYSGLLCIALCLTDHCLQSWSFRSLRREKRSDVNVPCRARRHLGRLMKDTQAARLPDWLLRSLSSSWEGKLTRRAQQPPSDGESQESPGGSGMEKWRGTFLRAALGERREACRKGEQTPGFSLPWEAGMIQTLPEASRRIPAHLPVLKITHLNPGHPTKQAARDTS